MLISRRRLHAIPGRLRIEVFGLRDNPAVATELKRGLGAESGVQSVTANPLTGKALIRYDVCSLTETRLIGLVEGFERERGSSRRAPPDRLGILTVVEPLLAATLFTTASSGLAVFPPLQEAWRGPLAVGSAGCAVAAGYPQTPTFGLNLDEAFDLARTVAYGTTDDLAGLAATAVSSYGDLAEKLTLHRAAVDIRRLVKRNIPGPAGARFAALVAQDPNPQRNRLPAAVSTYERFASVAALALSLVAGVLARSPGIALAVLTAGNPRPVRAGSITASAAAMQAAGRRRMLIRRTGAIPSLAATTVVLVDDGIWDAVPGEADAMRRQLQGRGVRVTRLRDAGGEAGVLKWQRHGRVVTVLAASGAALHAMRTAEVSVAVLGQGWTPPPHAPDIVMPVNHIAQFPELLRLCRENTRVNQQNRNLTAVLTAAGAALAAAGLLPITGAATLYNIVVLLTTLNARRLPWTSPFSVRLPAVVLSGQEPRTRDSYARAGRGVNRRTRGTKQLQPLPEKRGQKFRRVGAG